MLLSVIHKIHGFPRSRRHRLRNFRDVCSADPETLMISLIQA